MKIIDYNGLFENEIKILKKLNHENIAKYYDHFEIKIKNIIKELKLCIVTEYCEVIISFFILSFS